MIGKSGAKSKGHNFRKHSFVNRTIQLWKKLPADVLGTFSCKPSNFRKRAREVLN
jgi:hypothetical protein